MPRGPYIPLPHYSLPLPAPQISSQPLRSWGPNTHDTRGNPISMPTSCYQGAPIPVQTHLCCTQRDDGWGGMH